MPALLEATSFEVAVMPIESTGLLLEGSGGMDNLLEAMLALLSLTSLWPCLALRMVIGIILSPVVSAASEAGVEDVMMFFSSIMLLLRAVVFYARMCL